MTDHWRGLVEQQAADRARLEADVQHWRERALTAEARVDGQAWDDLTAERDRLSGQLEARRKLCKMHTRAVDRLSAELDAIRALGRCGDHSPWPGSVLTVCALPVDHHGWHKSDEGTEWSWTDQW